MVSRAFVSDAVRVSAFVLHAAMTVVVASLLFACKAQHYTNTGYRVAVMDWQVLPRILFHV